MKSLFSLGENNSTRECTNFASECSKDGVIRRCYVNPSFSNDDRLCDCTFWFGYVGKDCNKESGQLVYLRIMLPLIFLWSVIVILSLGNSITRFLWYSFENKRKIHPISITGVFFFASTVCLMLNSILVWPSLYDPTRFQIVEYNLPSNEEITVKHGKAAIYFLYLAPSFQIFGIFHIVFSWFRMLKEVNQIFPGLVKREDTIVKRLVTLLAVLYFLVTTIALAMNSPYILAFFLFFLITCTTMLYVWFSKNFMNRIKTLTEDYGDTSKNSDTLVYIRRCYRLIAVCVIPVIGFGCIYIYGLFYSYDSIPPGGFNWILFCRDISSLFGLVIATYIAGFVAKVHSQVPRARASGVQHTSYTNITVV